MEGYIRDQGHIRIRYREQYEDGSWARRAKSIILEDPTYTDLPGGHQLVSGRQVRLDGSPMDRNHILDMGLVEKVEPLVMNAFYCKLESRQS